MNTVEEAVVEGEKEFNHKVQGPLHNDNDIYYCIYGLSASHRSGLKRNNLTLFNLLFIIHDSVYLVSNHLGVLRYILSTYPPLWLHSPSSHLPLPSSPCGIVLY